MWATLTVVTVLVSGLKAHPCSFWQGFPSFLSRHRLHTEPASLLCKEQSNLLTLASWPVSSLIDHLLFLVWSWGVPPGSSGRKPGFTRLGMTAKDCERNLQGVSSIKEGHLPLQQHAFQTKGNQDSDFHQFWLFSESSCYSHSRESLNASLEGCSIIFILEEKELGTLSALSPWQLCLRCDSVFSRHFIWRQQVGGEGSLTSGAMAPWV